MCVTLEGVASYSKEHGTLMVSDDSDSPCFPGDRTSSGRARHPQKLWFWIHSLWAGMCLLVRDGVRKRHIPGKFPSFLQALMLPGMSCSQQVFLGEPRPPTRALTSNCLWARPRESWKCLLRDTVMNIICIMLAQQPSQWAYTDGKQMKMIWGDWAFWDSGGEGFADGRTSISIILALPSIPPEVSGRGRCWRMWVTKGAKTTLSILKFLIS